MDRDLALAFQLQDAGKALDEAKLALILKNRAKAVEHAREAFRCLSEVVLDAAEDDKVK
jgi:hypothetical protein